MKNLKNRLINGETLLGCWLNLGSSVTAEITGMSGFDWVLIDLEHGSGTENDLLYQLQALKHTPSFPIVRVESFERQRIHRVLDMGAEGVMCPRVNDIPEAERAAKGLRYTPEGIRGVAKMVRATDFGKNFDGYLKTGQKEILGIVQIETRGALDVVEEIAAIDGIDVLFIGPADLSMSLDVFGEFDHPRFEDAVDRTVKAAAKYGKASGILLPSPNAFKKYNDMGMKFLACGSDGVFVAEGATNMFNKLNTLRSTNTIRS